MVASFADAYTSVSVLAEPALPGDVTAAEGHAYCAAKLLLCVVSSFCGSTVPSLVWCLSVREYRNLDFARVDFMILSVCCLLGATVDTNHASVFGCFWMVFQRCSA